jgi:hypothetical protein
MRVLLDSSVLVADCQPEVFAILALGYLGRHRVLPVEFRAFAAWIANLDSLHRQTYELVFDDSATREAVGEALHEILVCIPGQASFGAHPKSMTPMQSVELLLQPFRLVLENTWNDWTFLLRMATPAERKELEHFFEKGWLVTSGGGLGELTKEVKRLRCGFESSLRVAACFDSDAEVPGVTSADAERAKAACSGILFHCLARRSIENYLPLQSLNRWATKGSKSEQAVRRGRVAALARLKKADAGRRNCFPMKNGFAALPPGLSAGDWEPLLRGFGKDIAALFEDDSLVTDEDLRADGGFDEVNPFVKQLIAAAR